MTSPNTRAQPDREFGHGASDEAGRAEQAATEFDGLTAAAADLARSSGEVSSDAFREIVMAQLRDPDAPRAPVHTAAPAVDETEPLPPMVEAAIERYREVRQLASEPDVAGALLFAAAAVTFMLIFAPMPGLVGGFGDVVGDTFGLLAVAIPLLLAWAAFMFAAERSDELPRGRLAAGGVVVAIFALGALRVWLPARDLWGLDVATVTSGGNLGQWFTTTIPGAIAWLMVGAAAFSILRPAEARRLAHAAPPAMRRGVKRAWWQGRGAAARRVDRSFDGAVRRKRAAVADRLQSAPQGGKRGSHLTSAMAAQARRDGQRLPSTDGRARRGPELWDVEPWETDGPDAAAVPERSQFRAKGARSRVASSPDVDASVRQLRIALGQDVDDDVDSDGAAGGFDARAEAVSAHVEAADRAQGYRRPRRRSSGARRERKQAEAKRTAATVPALTVLLLVLSIGVGIMVRGDLDRGQAQEVSSLAADLDGDTSGTGPATAPPLFGALTSPGAPQAPGAGETPEVGVVRNGGHGVGLYDDCNTATLADGGLAEGTTVQVIAAGAGTCEGWALVETTDGLATWLPTALLSPSN